MFILKRSPCDKAEVVTGYIPVVELLLSWSLLRNVKKKNFDS